ncbi:MAG: 30S ribosomal protein S20 [Oscillospiraceae bacterium]
MANHKSAKTRIKRNNKRAVINGARRSRVRTFCKESHRCGYGKQ